MESLPSDIVQDILCRVPAESVLECKLVCKKWVTVIRCRNFANMHITCQLNHLHGDSDDDTGILAAKLEPCLFFARCLEDPDELRTLLFHGGQVSDRISTVDEKYIYSQNLKRIYHPPMHNLRLYSHLVGSVNGLVCAFEYHNTILHPTYLSNPLTREYVYLPQLVVNKEDVEPYRIVEGEVNMGSLTACGFGYVQSTNEYKVVRIHYLNLNEGNVEVYTLGSGCGWRAIGRVPYRLPGSSGGRGTYANSAIYWIMHDKFVSFDLGHEEFRLLSLPPCMQNFQQSDKYELVALGGRLCLYMHKLRVEIWSLIKETWRRDFDIDHLAVVRSRARYFLPILLTKNGEIICLYAESVLYSYNTKTASIKMISNEASTDYFAHIEAVAHLNTFVSLEALEENSKRYTVRPRRVRTPWDDVIDELDGVSLSEKIDTARFIHRSPAQ